MLLTLNGDNSCDRNFLQRQHYPELRTETRDTKFVKYISMCVRGCVRAWVRGCVGEGCVRALMLSSKRGITDDLGRNAVLTKYLEHSAEDA